MAVVEQLLPARPSFIARFSGRPRERRDWSVRRSAIETVSGTFVNHWLVLFASGFH